MPTWTPFDLLQAAADCGAPSLQVCENLPLTTLSAGELDHFQAMADQAGVAIEVGCRGLGLDRLVRHAELAQRFGSRFVRVVIDDGEDEPSPDEALRRMEPILAALSRMRIDLAIENHDRFPSPLLVQMARKAGFKIVLDTANSIGCLEGPMETVRTLAPLTACLHIKDVVVRRVPSMLGFTVFGAAAGHGQLDVPAIIAEVEAQSPDATGCIELWPQEGATPLQTIESEREQAERSLVWMRR